MNYARMFTKRSDGRYMASYTQEGKRRWLYDRDPERLYQRLQDARKGGYRTFAQVVEEWREEHSRTVGFKTAESYVAPCRRICDVFGDDPPAEVTPARLQAFLDELGKKGIAHGT